MKSGILGVDIGGTFTDLTLFDAETGSLHVAKVPSVPQNESEALEAGVRQLLTGFDGGVSSITAFSHGTTVGTNALLQRRGARTALITTEGFADMLAIGRQTRPKLYDLFPTVPAPLIPDELCFEVRERVIAGGSVEIPLDIQSVDNVIAKIEAANVEAVVVCFLFSFSNASHEQAVRDQLKDKLPDVYCSISSDVLPEFREFERMSTTTANSYIGPVLGRYLDRFSNKAASIGIKPRPRVMQSNSGLMSISSTRENPVRTLLSGPCAGLIGAKLVAEQSGFSNVITYDMGGTSTEFSLLRNGSLEFRNDTNIENIPVRVPMVDIHTIGAGGGSIAWIDEDGLLKLGPHSQGAKPGPACYDLEGDKPTVTDANVLLGRLPPDKLLGGRMAINKQLSKDVINGAIAAPLGISEQRAALGILEILTANTALAARLVSIQRGYDIRDFALMAFGGAGPLHAVDLAREMNIRTVIVPTSPGTLCALGLLAADERSDFARTKRILLNELTKADFEEIFSDLERKASDWLDSENVENSRRRIERKVDVRYRGQNYELTLAIPLGPWSPDMNAKIARDFHQAHMRAYGVSDPNASIELITFRTVAIGEVSRSLTNQQVKMRKDLPQILSHRTVCFSVDKTVNCPIYARDSLGFGHQIQGPAIIDQMDTTTVIPPDTIGTIDSFGNLILELS